MYEFYGGLCGRTTVHIWVITMYNTWFNIVSALGGQTTGGWDWILSHRNSGVVFHLNFFFLSIFSIIILFMPPLISKFISIIILYLRGTRMRINTHFIIHTRHPRDYISYLPMVYNTILFLLFSFYWALDPSSHSLLVCKLHTLS